MPVAGWGCRTVMGCGCVFVVTSLGECRHQVTRTGCLKNTPPRCPLCIDRVPLAHTDTYAAAQPAAQPPSTSTQ
eukprot:3413221-Prymnesium_polylepis.1